MKIGRTHFCVNRATTDSKRGFAASVIVLALVAVMATLLLGGSRVVAALQRELRLVEQRQALKYDGRAVTNAPPARPLPAAPAESEPTP
jgi:hypothetical protein